MNRALNIMVGPCAPAAAEFAAPSFADRPPLQKTRMLEELAVACRDSVKELEEAFPFLMEGVEDE